MKNIGEFLVPSPNGPRLPDKNSGTKLKLYDIKCLVNKNQVDEMVRL
jgi:hypothetical protein